MKALINKYFVILEPKAIFLIGFLLSYPIALTATNSIPIRLPIDKLFMISLCVWIILYFIKPFKAYISVILMSVQGLWFFSLLAALPPYLQEGMEAILPGATKWATTIYDKLLGQSYGHFIYYIRSMLEKKNQDFHTLYYYIFIVFIIAAIMIVVMKLLEQRVNWKWFLMGTGYFLVAWFVYVSNLKGYFSLYFIGLTVYRQFLIYEKLVKDARELGERTRYYNYTSAIVIGTLVMVFVVALANISLLLLPIEKVNDKIHTYVPTISNIRSDFKSISSSKIFNFSSTMYAPNNNILGGAITDRDYSVIMRVKANEGSLYLRGRTKNVYDGSQWSTDFDIYYNNINSKKIIVNEHLEELVVYPESIVTRTLFSPYKYYSSSFSKDKIYGNEDSIVYRKTRSGIGQQQYSVNYINADYMHLYDILPDALRENYLSVPDQGLIETRALTNRLTTELSDPYEIMKTLERYLRDNYRYTLNTNEVDTERDFVENFLFVEEEGYCTYFATSLAVMGRLAGVPTRYVEGFITANFLDYQGFYEVSANRAHAWTEAYIEGQGWVKFEATPAYLNGDEVGNEDIYVDGLNSQAGSLVELDDGSEDRDEIIEAIEGTEKSNLPLKDMFLLGLYVLLIAGFIYLIYAKVKRLKSDINDGSSDEKINKRILFILSMCRLVDEDMNTNEFPKQVIKRISKDVLMIDLSERVENIINTSLYSNKELDDEVFDEFNEFFKAFELAIKKKISPLGHFIQKVMMNSLYHKNYYQE